MTNLTVDRLRKLLSYDSHTGVFTWLRRDVSMFKDLRACEAWNGRYSGRVAGAGSKVGYWTIRIEGVAYWAHRLAILWETGAWPLGQVDHLNGVRTDNRLCNLRDVSNIVNMQNMRQAPVGKALPLGVSYKDENLAKPFYAHLRVAGKNRHIGYFSTAEEAHAAYIALKRIHHPGCTL